MLRNTVRHRFEVVEDEPGPSLYSQQLLVVRNLQRIKKLAASMEVALARGALAACEKRTEDAREALRASEEHVVVERLRQRTEIAKAPRSARQLHEWRRCQLSLLDGVAQQRQVLSDAIRSGQEAALECERRRKLQKRLEAMDEKFTLVIDELAESEQR
jgi:hypothetical protein